MIASNPEAASAVLAGAAWPPWDSGVDGADGQMPLGLFRDVRTFEVSPDGIGGTAFHVGEVYAGPLLGLIWRSVPDLGPSSGRFVQGIKTGR